MMRWTLAPAALLLASPSELGAQGKGIRFWNLTTATISGFQLSPAGKDSWGPNQTLNDKDKEVDHDERLRITGVDPGRYDAKISYREECSSCSHKRRIRWNHKLLSEGYGLRTMPSWLGVGLMATIRESKT